MDRRQYTNEFKSDAVRHVRTSGKPVAQVARDLGINDNMLYRWVKEFGSPGDGSGLPTPSEHEELLKLRREVRILREERDILKKAAAYFAKEQF
jgi:transposase